MILELFSGAGGASLGIQRACPEVPAVGIEWDDAACRTRAAAGLLTIRADVSQMALAHLVGLVIGVWGSPPCPQFSAAGMGSGNAILDLLCEGIGDLLNGRDTRRSIAQRAWPIIRAAVAAENQARRKPRTAEQIDAEAHRRTAEACLVMEPARFAYDLRPQWVACEQVPGVLPIWRWMAHGLEKLGYSTWTGQLDTADYGVAQNRLRAVLMARAGDRAVGPPEPTHFDPRGGVMSLFDDMQEWVSMADRIGWGMTERPAMTVAVGTGGGPDPTGVGGSGARKIIKRERERERWKDGGVRVRTRGDSGREQDVFDASARPSRTITAKSDSWTVDRGT